MIPDEYLQTFVVECRELLEQMEEALLIVEQAAEDPEIINAIFRAAHTIKGSAGMFGIDHIVVFTHAAESVLDRVRSGDVIMTPVLAALLIEAHDHLNILIDLIAEGSQPADEADSRGKSLITRLAAYLGEAVPDQSDIANKIPAVYDSKLDREQSDVVGTDYWHISLRFGLDVFRDGMDPFSFIRCLCSLGRIVHLVTIIDAIPLAEEMNPESCYLGFEISFESKADKIAIENTFNFVRSSCLIRILPPRSKVFEYQRLILELPEQEMRLGEILVKCGTLTPEELENILSAQSESGDTPQRPIGEVLIEQQLVSPPVVEAALEKQKQILENKKSEANLIRVDADKLDELINLVGELIIAGAGTNLIAHRAGMSELIESIGTLSRLVEEVRDSALALRMVQIGATFNRFQRVVRDVSKELGKDVDLIISGAETELDKTVVEKIGDPLTHLVRNSMDHGIEPTELRIARGKPEQFKGAYAEIIGGVNEMLDAILLPIGEGNRILTQISDGKIEELIAQTYKGDHERMKQAVNNVATTLQGLQKELQRLTEASREGQLSERGKPKQFKGAYAEVVGGINEMLDAILLPIGEGNRILSLICGGDLRQRVEIECKGDHDKMKQAVNGVHVWLSGLIAYVAQIANGDMTAKMGKASNDDQIHEWLMLLKSNFQALVTDVNMLSVAAVEGRLQTRADAGKHQGDYRKIVEGFNETLDGVILPVNEVAAVLIDMEKGDLTRMVNGDYNGQLKDFKDTVNNTITKISQVIGEVNSAASNIASASEEVSATAQSMSQATSEQAASVEETSASIEQMSASINQNTENAKVTDGMATHDIR
jgi:methyl-accepting chemotaxis protein